MRPLIAPPPIPVQARAVQVLVRLHSEPPDHRSHGLVPAVMSTEAMATFDEWGVKEFWVRAYWDDITVSAARWYSVWSPDGSRYLGDGVLTDKPEGMYVRRGSLTLDSFPWGES